MSCVHVLAGKPTCSSNLRVRHFKCTRKSLCKKGGRARIRVCASSWYLGRHRSDHGVRLPTAFLFYGMATTRQHRCCPLRSPRVFWKSCVLVHCIWSLEPSIALSPSLAVALGILLVVVFPDSELSFIHDFIVNVFAGAKLLIYTRFAVIVARSCWFAGLHLSQHTCIHCEVFSGFWYRRRRHLLACDTPSDEQSHS